jgi:hypothetical protein
VHRNPFGVGRADCPLRFTVVVFGLSQQLVFYFLFYILLLTRGCLWRQRPRQRQ